MDFVVHKLNVKLTDEQAADANYTSEPFNIQSFSLFCVQFYWEDIAFSTLAPTLDIYGSNSLDAPFSSINVGFALSAGDNSSLVNVEKAGYAYIKIVYNKRDATAGKVSAIINAKVI
jgi:hypothetical protein